MQVADLVTLPGVDTEPTGDDVNRQNLGSRADISAAQGRFSSLKGS